MSIMSQTFSNFVALLDENVRHIDFSFYDFFDNPVRFPDIDLLMKQRRCDVKFLLREAFHILPPC